MTFGALALALLASLLLAASASADARSDAVAAYNQTSADARVDAGWTGSVNPCNVGTESQASIDATLSTLNILRDFAGLGPVSFSAEKNQRALAAATMMKAQGALSHDPDPSWKCYSDLGHFGAGTSNLYLGASGAEAMVGYVNDAGVTSLGHRRWILDPEAVEMGTGSTGTSNALVVIPSANAPAAPTPGDSVVGWPSAGLFPAPWLFEDWSVAIGNSQTQAAYSTENAQVSVSVDGEPAAVSGLRDPNAGIGGTIGTGRTLTWQVKLPASIVSGDHDIRVDISGVTLNGAPAPISYEVKAFDPKLSGSAAASPCDKAKAKLAKAKKKLKKAKRADKPKAKIKKAKRKVRKARATKKEACA